MDPGSSPSRTAFRVALRRASHQILDTPRVLDDPIAVRIVGDDALARITAEPSTWLRSPARGLRAFLVARSRVAEDALARAVARGVAQYVVLGAGLDTFAYRNPHPSLRVFEVDHPATQTWKRQKLAAARIAIPGNVTFAPVDFERQTAADGLTTVGWRADAPTFFSWLGVTMYLTEPTVMATLAWIATTPHGGGIVFDFAAPRTSLGFFGRLAFDSLARRVARAGEPFRTFFDPAQLAARMTAMGYRHVQALDRDALNARYFQGRTDKLRVRGRMAGVMEAEV